MYFGHWINFHPDSTPRPSPGHYALQMESAASESGAMISSIHLKKQYELETLIASNKTLVLFRCR